MTEQSNEEWGKLMADYQDAFASAEEWSNVDLPAGQTYTVLIKSHRKGAMKTGHPYWSISAECLDGVDENGNSLEGTDFQLAYLSMNYPGFLKKYVRVMTGEPVTDIGVADEAIEASMNKVVRIEAVKKGIHTNYNILEVLDDAAANAVEAAGAE